MRLAFVTSLLPTGKPDTGFEIANAAVIDALRGAGCKVDLFGILRPGEAAADADAAVLARMDIENAVVGSAQKLRWLAASYARGMPVIAAKIAPLSPALDAALAKAGPFDAVVVNGAPVATAFPQLMQRFPSLLVAHNVEHASARANAAVGGAQGLLYAREARLLEAAERAALAASSFVFCFAEEDRQGFGVEISEKSAVFPLLIPEPPSLLNVEPVHDIGLIGTWTWQPNLVGLRWFLDDVALRLPADITVAIAGRTPSDLSVAQSNVKLLGRVPDAAAFVASCRAMALTSRSGTGIQLKTIETFQMGRPAVATKSSVRGLVDLPTNCLVADEAERFAAALAKLVNDVKAERTLPADGRAFVARQREGMAAAVKVALAALKAG
jgi:hypothetical protein